MVGERKCALAEAAAEPGAAETAAVAAEADPDIYDYEMQAFTARNGVAELVRSANANQNGICT